LLKALTLKLNEPLEVECDNRQTLKLVTEESIKLSAKLRHVDIHNHWLRQEYAERQVLFKWTPTNNIIADGLTKTLPRQQHEAFIKQIKLDDIMERIQQEKRMEALRDCIGDVKASKAASTQVVFFASRVVNTRAAVQDLYIYRDLALRELYS
jgi:hypothetical protein